MTTLVSWLPVAWAVAILGVAGAKRPPVVRRIPRLTASIHSPPLPARLGGTLRRVCGRSPSAARDAQVGRALLVGAAGAVIDPRVGVAALIAAAIHPVVQRRAEAARHHSAVIRELPELIDLLRLAMSAGGSVFTALQSVRSTSLGPISDAIDAACARVEHGHRLADALGDVVTRTSDEVWPLIRALIGSEHYGTELLPTLERLGVEARDQRRRHAQAVARRVPIRLLLPLVMCILPAFVLLTLVPPLAGTLDGLGL